jgi:hypothetical protein
MIVLGDLSNGRKVVQIQVEVTSSFNGTPVLTVGDALNPSRLMTDAVIDLSSGGTYSTTSNFVYDSGQDTTITASFNAGGATVGRANITVTYV